MSSTIGKQTPAKMPVFKLLPAFCEIIPIKPGPNEPPKSPDNARRANRAVPPTGIVFHEMLMVPGHMIPTEKPQIALPARPRAGEFDNPANK